MVHIHCALGELRGVQNDASPTMGKGDSTCMPAGVGLSGLPVRQIRLTRDAFHDSHPSFGNPAARGDSARACGFVSHAFARFTLVETEPTSTFSSFAS